VVIGHNGDRSAQGYGSLERFKGLIGQMLFGVELFCLSMESFSGRQCLTDDL